MIKITSSKLGGQPRQLELPRIPGVVFEIVPLTRSLSLDLRDDGVITDSPSLKGKTSREKRRILEAAMQRSVKFFMRLVLGWSEWIADDGGEIEYNEEFVTLLYDIRMHADPDTEKAFFTASNPSGETNVADYILHHVRLIGTKADDAQEGN